ncbi:MAG: PKD domain-containing protein, partial [Flavobacteriales bacterium]|nr:PKD domain-containing protein [Flavobacteriales bacterium]
MKIKSSLSIIFIGLLSGVLGVLPQLADAQEVSKCGMDQAIAKYKAAHPEWYQIEQEAKKLEAATQAKMQGENLVLDACSDVVVIPVVFHIIHENGAENIPDQDVFDAIRMLNEDFRGWNEDESDVIAAFQSVIGESLIEFRLAQIDPSGNATNGIDRIQSSETNVGDDGSKLNSWPRSSYLNIWTVKVSPNGAAAYAYLPAGWLSASVDGIITRYSYVGDGERTLTHEVGHYLNLYHVWGTGNDQGEASNCSKDDFVSDTPNCIGTSGGCDVTRATCSTLDNIQNHMDYAACAVMFTAGQATRMRSALSSSTAQRNQLNTASNLIATGVYEGAAQFSTDLSEVCVGSAVQFKDQSYNGICQWEWTFQGGTPATSTERQPLVIYDNPGSYDVTLTVSNDTGSATIESEDYIAVSGAQSLPFSEDFPSGANWLITGDGSPTWEHTGFTYDGTSGSMAIYNFGQGAQGDVDELMSPSIDLSVLEGGQINFKVAYAQVDAQSDDLLRLYVSGDCGTTWTTAWLSGGGTLGAPNGLLTSNFVPNDVGDWNSYSINMPVNVLNSNFRFKYQFTSDEGNNVFLDNINISGTFNSTPLLISPTNFAVGQSPVQIMVDWDAVDNVDFYDYEIDKVNTFDSPFLITGTTTYINNSDNGTDTEYLVAPLDSSIDIYWKVRTRTGVASSNWSTTWKFSTTPTAALSVSALEADEINLVVFPNPSNGDVTIKFNLDQNDANVALEVFDMLGRSVSEQPPHVVSAGLQEFNIEYIDRAGVYYVRLNIDG